MKASDPARLSERPWELVKRTLGGPNRPTDKLARLAYALKNQLFRTEIDARLERLHDTGLIDRIPNRVQLVVGSLDMFRFFILPAANDFYTQQGFGFGFHSVLRFLDDPASVVDMTGLASHQDAIIGHLMQVVHANPIYDLQLLESIDGGLEELTLQLGQMIDGTHPRARSIGGIVEDPTYHARLLAFVEQYKSDPRNVKPMLRDNVRDNPSFLELQRTFGSLPSTMRYFCTLPITWRDGLHHLRTVRSFPSALVVAANDRPIAKDDTPRRRLRVHEGGLGARIKARRSSGDDDSEATG